MSSFGVYYLSSLILFLAFLGLFGLIGGCCGWIQDNANNGDSCPACACYPYSCLFVNCNDCNGSNDCGKAGGVILIVMILIFAVIGIFVGLILTVIIVRKVIRRHSNKLWLRQETKKYIVKDFQGKIHELEETIVQQRVTVSSIHI
ncbi:unnamed protein product [Rotaria sp. Silwood1]|nr:unnamed protein product [Rotaria sp. Silwood1]CAF4748058.1 unnamed protein product [Rotaria sp. Silwood1]CAF4876790.1 unnamed protein product [Rotaria sp. Silwood1]CAF4984054.1 unnamed protein product [Rotaria sp. Silwood1]